MDIGPGDWVQALRTFANLKAGSVWCVEELRDESRPCLECGQAHPKGIILVNDPGGKKDTWCSCIFRPYYGPEVEREHFFARDRGTIGRFEFYRLAVISGIEPK